MATTSKTGPDAARAASTVGLGVSAAGWSEPGPAPATDAAHPFAAAGDARYVELDQLGVGGMGEVALVRDRRLDRDLAYKRVPLDADDPVAAARLGREARITAALDHPGIVVIYDAGLDDAGRPFYTMRAVRGRSLAQRLAAAPTVDERRTLVRQLLAVAEAMAHAHQRGVIHRDLTPANVMLGEFGEVQVVDWGLAVRVDEPVPERSAGTPAYMSPERRSGASDGATPTSDVWSLGAIAREVAGPPPIASELAAVIAKATAPRPGDRYADAGELAAELRRYLDGRPVDAYAYSPLELARRGLWAWRWPLAAVGLAAVVGAAVAVGAWRRVGRERNRAILAERATRAALVDAEASLGRALASRAVRALEDGAIPEAELLAARALVATESPDARGVLAATRAVVAPLDARHQRAPACAAVLDADLDDLLCVDGTGLVLWSLAEQRVRWRVPGLPHDAELGPADTVLVTRYGHGVTALDRATGVERFRGAPSSRQPRLAVDRAGGQLVLYANAHYVVHAARDGAVVDDRAVCIDERLEVMALAGARLAAACRDGSVWTAEPGAPWQRLGALPATDGVDTPTALALRADGTLAIGTSKGWLVHATLAPWSVRGVSHARGDRVAQLAWSGDRLLVRGDRGGTQVWATDGSGARLRLPAIGNQRVRAIGDRVLAIGDGVWSGGFDATTGERGWQLATGVASVAVAPDGAAIAATRADGHVEVRAAATGAVTALRLPGAAPKQLAFAPDGATLFVAAATAPAAWRIELATATVQPLAAPPVGAVRLAVGADGALTTFHYGGARARQAGGAVTVTVGPEVIDVATVGDRLIVLAPTGALAAVDGAQWHELAQVPGATSLAAIDDARVAVGQTGRVVLLAHGQPLAALPVDGTCVHDLAVSPDRRWLAAACTDGAIRVWDLGTRARVATLRGHVQRVASVVFDRDGRLWSAGWDGAVRAWDVAAFTARPAALVADAGRRWGLALADAR